jgi:hypothetical protein
MGQIRSDVRDAHLFAYPDEEALLRPFLEGFDVTWGRRRNAFNTSLSVYFLRPEPHIADTFGFSQEILLLYSPFVSIETRTFQAAEAFLHDDPAKGRVERLTYFIISEMDDVEDWVRRYVAENHESRLIVAFAARTLRNNDQGGWFIRNVISRQLFTRDLFDYRLPLERDTYFFGRDDLLMDYRDAVHRSENRGLFGLRKTGKTSFLYKLTRLLNDENIAHCFFYDCKSPAVRKLRWYELLDHFCNTLAH